jgi:hypothetical protein
MQGVMPYGPERVDYFKSRQYSGERKENFLSLIDLKLATI